MTPNPPKRSSERIPARPAGPGAAARGAAAGRNAPGHRRVAALVALLLLMGASALPGCSDAPDEALEDAPAAAGPDRADPIVAREIVPLEDTLSPDARVSTFEMLEADLAAVPDAADGGGRVELVRAVSLREEADVLAAGTPARFDVRYTAGPLGVAEGGTVFLQPSPFWDWSQPQSFDPGAPGYTEVRTEAEGVRLELGPPLGGMLAVGIAGRALREGEAIDFVYGAGDRGALVDRYAEREAEISVSVDGDGDGYRKLVPGGARVDIVAGPVAQLVVFGPTVVRPGETFKLGAHLLDAVGNAGSTASGRLVWRSLDGEGAEGLPAASELATSAGATLELKAPDEPGVLRMEVRGEGALEGLVAHANPVVVHATAPRVAWGDLHGHSQLSDGTGTPDDYFAYARDVARLDVSALTDHDHWGLRFLDAHPEMWEAIKASAKRHHEPGRFVTLLGYEWTSWLHGHRHVLYFEDDGPVLSSMDPAYRNPAQLWAGLRGRPALTFAHHSAGGPVATNWSFGADPVLEPVTEIVSVHGSSESADTPHRIYDPVPGNGVRDVLGAGLRLGFIGSGDSHDGHPGLAQLAAPAQSAGLAAILTERLTRDDVLAALRARRTYATDGPRIWLQVEIDGHPMGATLAPAEAGATEQTLRIEVEGTAPIERIDLVRSGRVASLDGFDGPSARVERTLPRLAPGEWHYVRVVQRDGGVAWSSPIFAD